ncbi:EF-hand domain (C-terminal) containing [Perkinsus olseni]|uniref:EF-hand domain (C-terminal) containing n=2 Tax=Perkinsus olseni TaxID=32597 RepID=A0A7J6UJE1_PEROL|nr:EF-hand domain (C-terminal) containing [Perkinsus olseni]
METRGKESAPANSSKGRYRRRSKRRQQAQQQEGATDSREPLSDRSPAAADIAAPNPWQDIVDEPEAALPDEQDEREKEEALGDAAEIVGPAESPSDTPPERADEKGLRVQLEGLVPPDFNPHSDDEVIEMNDETAKRPASGGHLDGEDVRLLLVDTDGYDAAYGATKEDTFPRPEPGHQPFDLKCPVCGHSAPTVVTHDRSCGTYICMAILLVLFFPVCLLPLCCDSCQEATHRCENCEAFVQRANHHVHQTWGFNNGQRIEKSISNRERAKLVEVPRAPEGWRDGEALPKSTTRDVFVAPNGVGETEQLPAWDALDRHVLRFFGYYKEAVVESNLENYRVRPCILYYYLEDDTMHVSEPREDNSGLNQGNLLKRHRIPKGDGGGFIAAQDLMVGEGIKIYGRVIQITAVDGFTRSYYENVLKREQAPNTEVPEDTFAQTKKESKIARAAMPRSYEKAYREAMLGGGQANERLGQFLDKDRKVCRFYAVMDDLSTEQYERRPFTIFYFLSDDTIEIREQYPLNCGRDNFPIFFKRGRVAKDSMPVLGPSDPLPSSDVYYKVDDLYVGQTIRLVNNDLFIYDADAFTREYFKRIGIDLAPKRDVRLPEKVVPRPPTPPYTGYGSWDDSLGSVLNLVPKVPKKDMQKLLINEGKVLRFLAAFSNPEPEDVSRRFVFNYHLFDDTLSIHEPPQRNLGIVTGKFLEKGIHLNEATGRLVNPLDLIPGKIAVVFNHSFIMTGCDDYTRKYFAKVYPDVRLEQNGGDNSTGALVPDEE